ncbi:PEP-CTERM sorting domain-containing protein [Colwellia sp. 1_MG-2023]|uniref:PEP-CTERM sorting domain-containing protein n=1 Tax=unclassified Colwellia TaxID=196834 RepID=UPI001C085443|nr:MULTISPECIES: PEP-CTERM sorting domain-containing protein [unclassified Colwellia]MBU2925697.1 PEP-CTERM sorting domain-containing protein [Colwellia sp. C2M11]MDO6487820.1 PEP-CTERM sorting domain-containing protein [Colwellia sp. 6_MG-2023]MDO6651077.1 PEP-CTERM sorting domain-containing protein [Colwellia sp. 3_MG-2023]MDO6664112.1 PEP-CTERM sorting domain-containing protein [Colwellia sp. 2_MG-2023]MDO6688463.1 PEP-CTERM sorting domain-containing protein [Colwellia sp. 1_MG-2023]
MKTFKKKLLAAVTVMALSPLAQAGVISFSDNHAASTTEWSDVLTVSQFDASLGNLDTINISFSASMLSDITLNNNDNLAQTTRGSVGIETIGTFLGLGSLTINLSADTGFVALGADGALDGSDIFTAFGLTGTDTINATIDSSNTDFLSFIGTGNVSTSGLTAFGNFGGTGGSNTVISVDTVAGASLNVTYNYTETTNPTPVSEPTSLAILGLGLAGIALRRKKKSL